MSKSSKSKKSVTQGDKSKETPTSGPKRPKLKLKNAPRGRPFAKNNSFGIATRFKPGHRAKSPGLRHVSKEVSDALRRMAAMETGTVFEARSNAEWVAVRLFRMIQDGSLPAIRELVNRTEGLPTQSIRVDDRANPFLELVAGMDRLHAKIGPPEPSNDYLPEKTEARDDDDNSNS
jgi:hypothetical protein